MKPKEAETHGRIRCRARVLPGISMGTPLVKAIFTLSILRGLLSLLPGFESIFATVAWTLYVGHPEPRTSTEPYPIPSNCAKVQLGGKWLGQRHPDEHDDPYELN